jgi:hypothetical protein
LDGITVAVGFIIKTEHVLAQCLQLDHGQFRFAGRRSAGVLCCGYSLAPGDVGNSATNLIGIFHFRFLQFENLSAAARWQNAGCAGWHLGRIAGRQPSLNRSKHCCGGGAALLLRNSRDVIGLCLHIGISGILTTRYWKPGDRMRAGIDTKNICIAGTS